MIKYQKGNKKSIINIKVSGVKKLNNSSNGNPKYEFHFHKGGIVTTPSDAGWVYAFSTDTFWGRWVDITYHMNKGGKAILDSIKLNEDHNEDNLVISGIDEVINADDNVQEDQ